MKTMTEPLERNDLKGILRPTDEEQKTTQGHITVTPLIYNHSSNYCEEKFTIGVDSGWNYHVLYKNRWVKFKATEMVQEAINIIEESLKNEN